MEHTVLDRIRVFGDHEHYLFVDAFYGLAERRDSFRTGARLGPELRLVDYIWFACPASLPVDAAELEALYPDTIDPSGGEIQVGSHISICFNADDNGRDNPGRHALFLGVA
ncbi:MAG: hypothetical protein ACIAXF_05885 [Phycisphaerales bacterium JB063]